MFGTLRFLFVPSVEGGAGGTFGLVDGQSIRQSPWASQTDVHSASAALGTNKKQKRKIPFFNIKIPPKY
jgi:hypothetical protein